MYLDEIAQYLYEKETITGKQFMEIYRKVKGIPEPVDTSHMTISEKVAESVSFDEDRKLFLNGQSGTACTVGTPAADGSTNGHHQSRRMQKMFRHRIQKKRKTGTQSNKS